MALDKYCNIIATTVGAVSGNVFYALFFAVWLVLAALMFLKDFLHVNFTKAF